MCLVTISTEQIQMLTKPCVGRLLPWGSYILNDRCIKIFALSQPRVPCTFFAKRLIGESVYTNPIPIQCMVFVSKWLNTAFKNTAVFYIIQRVNIVVFLYCSMYRNRKKSIELKYVVIMRCLYIQGKRFPNGVLGMLCDDSGYATTLSIITI